MFDQLFNHIINEEKEFDLSSIQRDFWFKLIGMEQDAADIHFDLENNDPATDSKEPKEIELDIKHPNGEPVKVLCQLWYAGGDWESPVGYFKCQYKPSGWFIYIPGPEVNKNLVKRDKGYSPITNDESGQKEKDETKDTDLWDDLKKGLADRLGEESDPDKWEMDYKKARIHTGYPTK